MLNQIDSINIDRRNPPRRRITLREKLGNLEREIAWLESESRKNPKAARENAARLAVLEGARDQLRRMVERSNWPEC